jgi:hypothetical protein
MTMWEIRFSPCSPEAIRKGKKRSFFRSLRHTSKGRDDVSHLSPVSEREVNKVIRAGRAVHHIPLDVEIARTLVVDRFPSRQSRFR